MKVTQLISATALLAGLFVLETQTATAQQTVAPAPAPASVSATSPLPGPRLSPEFRRAEPALGSSVAVAGNHTIVVSTLVLVLAIVIIVLLVAK